MNGFNEWTSAYFTMHGNALGGKWGAYHGLMSSVGMGFYTAAVQTVPSVEHFLNKTLDLEQPEPWYESGGQCVSNCITGQQKVCTLLGGSCNWMCSCLYGFALMPFLSEVAVICHWCPALCGALCTKTDSQIPDSISKKVTIRVTGHSLGGAMATLCALKLKLKGFENVELVTFGSPRLGNHHFSRFMKLVLPDTTARFVNGGDPVPMYPPKIMYYAHVGKTYSLGEKMREQTRRQGKDVDEELYEYKKGPCGITRKVPKAKQGHSMNAYKDSLQKCVDGVDGFGGGIDNDEMDRD
jgi:hypothetical protein